MQQVPQQQKRLKSVVKHQQIKFSVPVSKYWNRFTNIKPSGKNQLKFQIMSEKLIVKQFKVESLQPTEIDNILIFDIQTIDEKEKQQEKYTLWKIVLNTVPDKDKNAITVRVLNIIQARDCVSYIRKRMNEMTNVPSYVEIQKKQLVVMKSIILKQPQYHKVFKRAQHIQLFHPSNDLSTFQFQRLLLSEHPQMIRFNILKHQLKYEQQKTILMQRLKLNNNEEERGKMVAKKNMLNARAKNIEEATNIDRNIIEDDLEKMKKDGKQGLEGYSSKRELEGVNLVGGEEQLFMNKDGLTGSAADNSDVRRENLILNNIHVNPEHNDMSDNYFEENYNDYAIVNNLALKKSLSKGNLDQVEKMQIQEGQIYQTQAKNSKQCCTRLKIPESKDIRLEQKSSQSKSYQKSDIKFIDPSYNYERQQFITKETIIWCRLFYHYLKEGGIQKKQKQLTAIEAELKMLKHSEQQSEMNEFVSKMIEKVSFNYLRMKRGQDVY